MGKPRQACGTSAVSGVGLRAILKDARVRLGVSLALTMLLCGASSPEWFTPAGSWPGHSRGPALAVAVSGHYAYVAAEEGGLLIFDVSNPALPIRVGEYYLSGWTRSIQIQGDIAILSVDRPHTGGCSGRSGQLELLDLTNPVQPGRIGTYPVSVGLVQTELVAQRAYVLAQNLLEVVDLSNPAEPMGLGGWRPEDGNLQSFRVVGQYAYAVFDSYLKIIDVSNPTRFAEVGAVHIPRPLASIEVNGRYAYALSVPWYDGTNSLSIFDVSNPARPSICGGLLLTNPVHDLAVKNNRAYLAGGVDGLVVADIADPAQPAWVTNCCTGGTASGIALQNNQVYVASYEGGLSVFDLSDPDAPAQVSALDTGLVASWLQIQGTNAFLVSSAASETEGRIRLEVLGYRPTLGPQLIGSCELTGSTRLQVVNDRAYAPHDSRVDILDLGRLEEPVVCGAYVTDGWVQSVLVRSNYMYLGIASQRLEVVDVSEPANPRRVVALPICFNGAEIALNGNYLYVPEWIQSQGTRVAVLNAGVPPNLFRAGQWDYFYPGMLRAAGNLMLSASGNWLTVLDVSNPLAFHPLGSCDCQESILDLDVAGHYAYLAVGMKGVEVVDLSIPTAPVPVAHYDTPGRAVSIRVRDSLVYVADAAWGLTVLKLPVPPVTIVEQPQSQVLAAPGFDALSVRAYGTAALSYQWYQGESGDTSHPVAGANSSIFILPVSVTPTVYWVRVSSTAGSADSQTARVTPQAGLVLQDIGGWPGYPRGQICAASAADGYACLAVNNLGLAVVDVRDPARPVLAGTWTPADVIDFPIRDVVVSNHCAYVLRYDWLQVVDITNPAKPVFLGEVVTSGQFLRLAGSYVVVAADTHIRIFDVSIPGRPTLVASKDLLDYVYAIEVAGQYVYAASGARGLQIVDISDPSRPVLAGVYPCRIDIQYGSYPDYLDYATLTVADQRAYLGVVTNELKSLDIVDVSNAAAPRRLGGYFGVAGLNASSGLCYLCLQNPCGQSHLEVVDFRNPNEPMSLGSCDLPGSSLRSLHVSGPFLYVADAFTGLDVMSLSDPAAPAKIGNFNPYGEGVEARVHGNLAFLADGPGGLRILDISNPVQPALMGEAALPGGTTAVRVLGEQAILANWGSLSVIDITNPACPFPLGWWGISPDLGDADSGFG